MTYVSPDFPSAAALRCAFYSGLKIEVYEPGLGSVPTDGLVFLEGPHSPKPHTWYVAGTMKDGKLVGFKPDTTNLTPRAKFSCPICGSADISEPERISGGYRFTCLSCSNSQFQTKEPRT